jgi:hypothetical protein
MTDVDDFLAHFGVKGMKWGKRKIERKTAQLEKSRAANYDKLKKRLATEDTKWSKMTTPELQAAKTKLQKRLKNADGNDIFFNASAGVKLSKSQKIAMKLDDRGIKEKSEYGLLTSSERMKIYALERPTDKSRAIRKALIGQSVGLGVAMLGTMGALKLSGGSPALQRQGQMATVAVLGAIGGKIMVSEIKGIKAANNSLQVHEIDRELRMRSKKK